jgi:hypothetical protein
MFGKTKKGNGDTVATEEVSYIDGNKNTPVIILGDDPGNEENGTDNVLVSRLPNAESVPRDSVYAEGSDA